LKSKVASFLVPLLTALVLLYQVLSNLRIAVTYGPALLIIGVTLAVAAGAGALAALGPQIVRVGVLAACVLLFLDVTFHLPGIFRHLRPEGRRVATRDERRIDDLKRIKAALDRYVAEIGPLPLPNEYGEGTGPETFWGTWWDVSSQDGNHNGLPFLDFLVEGGILPAVPVDPENTGAADGDPRGGRQYVYFVVPPKYDYAGGACDSRPDRWHYLIGITDLEEETSRPPTRYRGSGCECLWKDQPNFFQQHFDYLLCGSFDAPDASRARGAGTLAKRAAANRAAKQEADARMFEPQDRRRVADILRIRQALQTYVATVGPLPAPSEYGEGETGSKPGFWQGSWDVSSEDGDHDGDPFLDFLADSGTMPSVPVDPENQPAADGDPRGGRQYVYFVAPSDERYEGGSCAGKDEWVYLLGITDLRSEHTRPPAKIQGSGCDCLWRNQPGFFQQQFDYVVCGKFQATPEARARAAQTREKQAAAARIRKQAAALRDYGAQDRRRVADLLRIKQGLQAYLAKVGPLPSPADYGEGETGSKAGFWQGSWDVSSQDGDGDGKPFLDFLSESGTMDSVPLDPDNQGAPDGDPRGGRQYVYFVVPPTETYTGGSCGASKGEWVYLLGITDLRSELTRPPANLAGSGCDCLWRDRPNFFQQHFDYVTCGTFTGTSMKGER
jgi:hypothetical protein